MRIEVDSLVSGTELEGWVKGEVGELWADRYKLLDDLRFPPRSEGSDRLAIALLVLSRANVAARMNREGRFLEGLVDKPD